jgi:hypothetical protein
MKKLALILAAMAIAGGATLVHAQGPGQCGTGKRWNAAEGKCEAKAPSAAKKTTKKPPKPSGSS